MNDAKQVRKSNDITGNRILCSGSIALDTTRTPSHTAERVLGGAASYFSYSASFFSPVSVVTAVGGDFPQKYWDFLSKRVNLSGVQRIEGAKTFFYDSSFDKDLGARKTNATELNVLGDYDPMVPAKLSKPSVLYLATMPPGKQGKVIGQTKPSLIFLDTIEYYIENNLAELKQVIARVDGIVLNDAEARQLSGTTSLVKAGAALGKLGPKVVIVKKGEHGCLLFFGGKIYPLPAFPLEEVVDPSGAGDSFAGGMMGVLAATGATRETLDGRVLREAVAVGTVMGSFAVEGFSLDRLAKLDNAAIGKRLAEYKQLLRW